MTPAQKGHASMLLFSALVAGSFSLGGQIANEVAPAALNALRFWLAAGVIGLAALATTGMPRHAFVASWRYAVLGGLFGTYFVLMFEGLKTAPPVSAAAVFTLTPVIAAGFGWLLLRQIVTPRIAVALIIGAMGALWVIFRADLAALKAFAIGRGEIIYFTGCICHALYTPMVRKLNRGEPAVVFTFGTLVAGAILLTVFGWRDIAATPWTDLSGMVWFTLIYLSFFASAASFVLLQTATLCLPSSKVMAYTYLVPSWVIGWEAMLGQGLPPPIILGGAGLTMIALALLLRDEGAVPRPVP
ncbi:DMT family transporter [Roseobacter litoralis]|nr:DMT family transporter [Roseobacter litoralis]